MSETKLLTVRIDEATRQRFTDWAKDNRSNASELIKIFIDKCLDGSIDIESILASGDINIETKDIDSRIAESIDSQLAGLKNDFNQKIVNLEEELAKK